MLRFDDRTAGARPSFSFYTQTHCRGVQWLPTATQSFAASMGRSRQPQDHGHHSAVGLRAELWGQSRVVVFDVSRTTAPPCSTLGPHAALPCCPPHSENQPAALPVCPRQSVDPSAVRPRCPPYSVAALRHHKWQLMHSPAARCPRISVRFDDLDGQSTAQFFNTV